MQDKLLIMWRLIIYDYYKKVTGDKGDAFIDHVTILPIDIHHCLTHSKDLGTTLYIQEKGVIINSIEGDS